MAMLRHYTDEVGRFLVVYDYGQGGAWAFVAAKSASDITTRFPELKVVDRPAGWMMKEDVERIQRDATYDLDEPAKGILAEILIKREGSGARGSASSGAT
ncbi:MAG: hypothetical protein ACRDIA_03030 [Actinomycetota bacterium]